MGQPRPTVLLVDDDPQVRDVYAAFLDDDHHVHVADSGESALEAMGPHVDLVLLDRRMLGLSGGDVLERIRDAGYAQPVAMVTAVQPDFDILDMGFDDYLVKPVRREELRDLVRTMLLRTEYDAVMREYFALVSKVEALQRQKPAGELAESVAYGDASDRLEVIKAHAKAALETALRHGTFDDLFYELEARGEEPTYGLSVAD